MRFCSAGLSLWVLLLSTPVMAQSGRLGGGGTVDVSMTRIVMALLLGTMLAVLAALLLKRGGGRLDMAAARRLFTTLPTARRIQIIESRRVSQHADLCLVRCDSDEYLILCSAQHQQILRAREAPQAPEQAGSGESTDA